MRKKVASEMKPAMRPAHISEFIGRSKVPSAEENSVESHVEKGPSEAWWAQHAGWRTPARRTEESQEMSQRPMVPIPLHERVTSQKLSSAGVRSIDLPPLETEAVKITTIVETIRRRRIQRSVESAGRATRDIPWKKRSRRSLDEPETRAAKGPRRLSSSETRADDLRATNNVPIPSTVFYKRIWEYINGTRPHSDIVSGYGASADHSGEAGNSACADKDDPVAVSQSRTDELRAAGPAAKPEREFYKRIWDIINATSGRHRTPHEKARTRPKRNADIPTGDTVARTCAQEADREGGEQTTNEEARRRADDATGSRRVSDPYVSGFWAVASKDAQWQPLEIAIPQSSGPISRANEATEAADLNRSPPTPSDGADDEADSFEDDDPMAKHAGEETRGNDRPHEPLTEPGPPYLPRRENSTVSSLAPTINEPSRNDDRAEYVEHDETTSSLYDPSNIPYVEVPDYSDRPEDTLEKKNHSANEYKVEYDDAGDYVDPGSYRVNEAQNNFSAKSPPSAEIQLLPGTRAERVSSLDVSRCTENRESFAECASDERDAPDRAEDDTNGEARDRSENNANNDAQRPPEVPEQSTERDDSGADFAPAPFDIEEYRKPFDLDDFFKDDSAFRPVGDGAARAETRHEDESRENPKRNYDVNDTRKFEKSARDDETMEFEKSDRDDGSEESEKSDRNDESGQYKAAYPRAGWYDYFAKNVDFHDDDDEEEEKTEETDESDPREEKVAKSSETINGDYRPPNDRDFLRHIFEKDDGGESRSDVVDTENEFLSRYFTEDVLRQLRENSTAAEDRKREESRNRENIHKTLSRILDKKDRFSRLDENLDKMIEEGETVPIRYNNFWSLEYESPRRKNNSGEAEEQEEKEQEEEEEEEEA